MGISPRTGAILATPLQSDIREHCLKHGKQINGDNFKIHSFFYKDERGEPVAKCNNCVISMAPILDMLT